MPVGACCGAHREAFPIKRFDDLSREDCLELLSALISTNARSESSRETGKIEPFFPASFRGELATLREPQSDEVNPARPRVAMKSVYPPCPTASTSESRDP